MKKVCLVTMIVAFLLISTNAVRAQMMQPKLNQIELNKQFLGNWKIELGKDTICFVEVTPFGVGFEATRKFVTKGNIYNTWKELNGYDKKTDKFIDAQLQTSSSSIYLVASWFTSKSICESIPFQFISDPEKATVKWTWEFKSSDLVTETTTRNNKIVSTLTYTREKK